MPGLGWGGGARVGMGRRCRGLDGQEVPGLGWGGGARVPEDKMDALSAKLQG